MNIRYLFILLLLLPVSCRYKIPRETRDSQPLNVLLITLDDMGYSTTGAEGSSVPGITPHIDQLARDGIMFTHGFVVSPICGPSRSVMLSGRYPHNNGVMGHGEQPPPLWQQPEVVTPTISKYLHGMGYTTGAILKNNREINNVWDIRYHELPYGMGFHDRNPDSFYKRTKAFITSAREQKKPFFLYANPIDPHRPWVNTSQEQQMLQQWNPERPYPAPSRKYTPEEIEVPHFLPDLPGIRKNLVPYYESLHRGDECIGGIIRALDESGESEHTIVIFLSDHGMAATGAKATLYHDGIRTPLIVRWPGIVKEGQVDDSTIVSSVDIVPTLLEAIGAPPVNGLDGISFYHQITGEPTQSPREYAYTATNYYNQSTPEEFLPQRAIIDKEYCYIFNSYVKRSKGTQSYRDGWMDVVQPALDGNHPQFSQKVHSILHKPVEELYDLNADPGCWNNLAGLPEYAGVLNRYRERLESEMLSSHDPELTQLIALITTSKRS
ncbi:MAG: sulfatase [Bacteroidota bacterium]